MSNQLDSTRIERLVTIDVDPSYRKSICKTLRNIPRVATKGVADFNNNNNNNNNYYYYYYYYYYYFINNNNNKGLMTTFLQGSSTFVIN